MKLIFLILCFLFIGASLRLQTHPELMKKIHFMSHYIFENHIKFFPDIVLRHWGENLKAGFPQENIPMFHNLVSQIFLKYDEDKDIYLSKKEFENSSEFFIEANKEMSFDKVETENSRNFAKVISVYFGEEKNKFTYDEVADLYFDLWADYVPLIIDLYEEKILKKVDL